MSHVDQPEMIRAFAEACPESGLPGNHLIAPLGVSSEIRLGRSRHYGRLVTDGRRFRYAGSKQPRVFPRRHRRAEIVTLRLLT